MKLKFLDKRNCKSLLPPSYGTPVLQRLDECLIEINDKYSGSIRSLIKRNRQTLINSNGSERLCTSPIKIAQAIDVQTKVVNTQAIFERRPGPAELLTLQFFENSISMKTIVPLQYLLKGWGDAKEGHQCYIHYVSHNMEQKFFDISLQQWHYSDSDNYYYVGITGRNWLLRLTEHIGEIRRGSGKRFHKAWRESWGKPDVQFSSYLININQTYEDAMNWEERNVDRMVNSANCLNMIPGGFKGLKFLHEHRITDRVRISLEQRDKAVTEFARQNPRKGIPNPFIAELWKDDEHYIKVIEGRPKTLTRDQVSMIRELNKLGRSIPEIAKEVGALNEAQVKRVIEGKTYKRYH